MAGKTNAVRLVQQAKIDVEEAFYEYDENDLKGTHAADAMGLPYRQVYKTLVTRGPRNGIHIFCISVCDELDLKKAAAAAGEKSIAMVQVKELLGLTGYIRGGCSPVGMKKKYPTHLDTAATEFQKIAVSAGQRGHQMILDPKALAALIGAEFADVTK